MAEKRPKLPLVLTANELLDGHVVYFDGNGWSPRIEDALVAADDATATSLEQRMAADITVVEPSLVTVTQASGGRPAPIHYREDIRISGPTIAFGLAAQPAATGAA